MIDCMNFIIFGEGVESVLNFFDSHEAIVAIFGLFLESVDAFFNGGYCKEGIGDVCL